MRNPPNFSFQKSNCLPVLSVALCRTQHSQPLPDPTTPLMLTNQLRQSRHKFLSAQFYHSHTSTLSPLLIHEGNQLMISTHFFSSSNLSLLLLLLSPLTTSQRITGNSSSLDALILTLAFRPLPHHRSNHPYHLHLPSNLSSITAAALRLRGADLWLRGTNLGYFHLPPGIFTAPHVKRTLLVFYDLGNLSSSFFSVPGYVLVSPVVACLAYDASNMRYFDGIREVSLRPTRDPIKIVFPPMVELSGPARCVRFGSGGLVRVSGVVAEGMRCEVMGTGYFSVVVEAPPLEGEGKGWWVWLWLGIGCGVVGMVSLAFMRVRRKRRMEEMERSREEGEVLDSVWVGGSKLPAAAVARTTPAIESDSVTYASSLT